MKIKIPRDIEPDFHKLYEDAYKAGYHRRYGNPWATTKDKFPKRHAVYNRGLADGKAASNSLKGGLTRAQAAPHRGERG